MLLLREKIKEAGLKATPQRMANASSWNTAFTRSSGATAQAKNVPGYFWTGREKTVRCMQSLTTAAMNGVAISGKLSALLRTELTSGANH